MSKALGVSTATISNAFNRPDQLSVALRDKILKECKALGYAGPSLAARSLRSGKSGVIAVMLSDSLSYSFSDPMANSLLEGVSLVLAEQNKQLLLLSSTVETSAQVGAESLPDGFIFYGTPAGSSLERILAIGKPCVSIDFSHPDMPSVNVDNQHAASELAQYAIHDVKDVVAIIGMRILLSPTVERLRVENDIHNSQEIAFQRLQGYIDGAAKKGIDIAYENKIHIPLNTIEYAEQAAHLLLSQENRPNVILCMSDVIAMTVCRIAAQLGLRVPQDVRITGFDDISEATRTSPSLTTCSQQGREKGIVATHMLLNGEKDDRLIPVVLQKRASA